MSKRGRKLKEYKTYKTYDSKGKTFIQFKDIWNIKTNLNNIPKEADIMSVPVVQYKENGDIVIVAQLPVGYFI